MNELRDFHHFSTTHSMPSDPVERLERYIADLMQERRIPDGERDSSFTWEFKHASSTIQFARLLARRRQLDEKICASGLLLHDIHLTLVGSYPDHARLGAQRVPELLAAVGGYSAEEVEVVVRIVARHSDKHIVSDDPYEEFGKDIDVLDCFLYPSAFDYYLRSKNLGIFETYCQRARSIFTELGLPPDDRFAMLEGYVEPWIDAVITASPVGLVTRGTSSRWPPYLVASRDAGVLVAVNGERLRDVCESSRWSVAECAAVFAGFALASLDATELDDGAVVLIWPAIDRYERLGDVKQLSTGGPIDLSLTRAGASQAVRTKG